MTVFGNGGSVFPAKSVFPSATPVHPRSNEAFGNPQASAPPALRDLGELSDILSGVKSWFDATLADLGQSAANLGRSVLQTLTGFGRFFLDDEEPGSKGEVPFKTGDRIFPREPESIVSEAYLIQAVFMFQSIAEVMQPLGILYTTKDDKGLIWQVPARPAAAAATEAKVGAGIPAGLKADFDVGVTVTLETELEKPYLWIRRKLTEALPTFVGLLNLSSAFMNKGIWIYLRRCDGFTAKEMAAVLPRKAK